MYQELHFSGGELNTDLYVGRENISAIQLDELVSAHICGQPLTCKLALMNSPTHTEVHSTFMKDIFQ
jgi:hypothetical protein